MKITDDMTSEEIRAAIKQGWITYCHRMADLRTDCSNRETDLIADYHAWDTEARAKLWEAKRRELAGAKPSPEPLPPLRRLQEADKSASEEFEQQPALHFHPLGWWVSIRWVGRRFANSWGIKDFDRQLIRLWMGPLTLMIGRKRKDG